MHKPWLTILCLLAQHLAPSKTAKPDQISQRDICKDTQIQKYNSIFVPFYLAGWRLLRILKGHRPQQALPHPPGGRDVLHRAAKVPVHAAPRGALPEGAHLHLAEGGEALPDQAAAKVETRRSYTGSSYTLKLTPFSYFNVRVIGLQVRESPWTFVLYIFFLFCG